MTLLISDRINYLSPLSHDTFNLWPSPIFTFSQTQHVSPIDSFNCLSSIHFLWTLLDSPGMLKTAGYSLLERFCPLALGDPILLGLSCLSWFFLMGISSPAIPMMPFLAHCSSNFTTCLNHHIHSHLYANDSQISVAVFVLTQGLIPV